MPAEIAGVPDDGKSVGSGLLKKKKGKKKAVVEKKLAIFRRPVDKTDLPGMTFVDDAEGVAAAFLKINRYLRPTIKQLSYEIFVSFGGFKISRDGFLSLIAVTTGEGETWIFDVITLEDALWDNGMKEFLETCYQEKTMFNVRGVKDLLYNCHNITLKGVLDLRIVEIYERGKIKTQVTLPYVQIERDGVKKSVLQKEILFTLPEMFVYYMDEIGDMDRICSNIEEKKWRSRRNGVEFDNKKWVFEFQKFLILFWKQVDFSDEKKTNLMWVSSEMYTSMWNEKVVRTYDKYEENDYLPPYILCFNNTDQPLGGVSCCYCMRKLPSEQFTKAMLLNRPTCQCVTCLKVASGSSVKTVKAPPKKKKKKKKKGKKKVKIEGEETETSSDEEEEEEEEEAVEGEEAAK